MNNQFVEEANLYFCEGTSDKVYRTYIIAEGDGYMVGFTYGRRNGRMNEGFKTSSPVSLEKAKKEFDKLIASKEKKGYIRN